MPTKRKGKPQRNTKPKVVSRQKSRVKPKLIQDKPLASKPRFSLAKKPKRARKADSEPELNEIELGRQRPAGRGSEAYAAHKEHTAEVQRELSAEGRDIGPIPAIVNPERRLACSKSLKLHLETYRSKTFDKPWAKSHLAMIPKIEQAAWDGGSEVLASERGGGKTTILEGGMEWALLNGHCRFGTIIGATDPHAYENLDSIRSELETNDLLLEDYPEVCYPIRKLDGIPQRASGQLCCGNRTRIGWKLNELILPTIKGSKASGSRVCVAGITGRIRGIKRKLADGTVIRPDFVLVDDPQTEESANSVTQCEDRIKIIKRTVLHLCGPGKKIALFIAVTVVRAGDLADELLNRELHPEFSGAKSKMLISTPTNEKLWDEYNELRLADLASDRKTYPSCKAFYEENRKAMDEGAEVNWPERFLPYQVSGTQHAMHLKLTDPLAFAAEFQQEPIPEGIIDVDLPTADVLAKRCNHFDRFIVPASVAYLTSGIDVQLDILYWTVVGWEDNFTGYVVGYGAWPDQGMSHFAHSGIRNKLRTKYAPAGKDGAILAGLGDLEAYLLGREWKKSDGSIIRMSCSLRDANYQTTAVYQSVRQSKFPGVVLPSRGQYVGASSRSLMEEKKKKDGEIVGINWRKGRSAERRDIQHVRFDTNYWKSFLVNRLTTAPGDVGAVTLYGKEPSVHRMYVEHLTSEYRVTTQGRGRTVDEWKEKPKHPDNHFWDCTVLATVAASVAGARLKGFEHAKSVKQVELDPTQMQKDARAEQYGRQPNG